MGIPHQRPTIGRLPCASAFQLPWGKGTDTRYQREKQQDSFREASRKQGDFRARDATECTELSIDETVLDAELSSETPLTLTPAFANAKSGMIP